MIEKIIVEVLMPPLFIVGIWLMWIGIRGFWNACRPAKPLQIPATPVDLKAIYESWLTRRKYPNRKNCLHGHPICFENANPYDLRRYGLYYCKICYRTPSADRFTTAFNAWLKRRKYPQRDTCKRGHRICLENAKRNDMLKHGRYVCRPCLKQLDGEARARVNRVYEERHKTAGSR
jgi:hypothetical protein